MTRGTKPGPASPRWIADATTARLLDALRARALRRDVGPVGARTLADDLGWSRAAVVRRLALLVEQRQIVVVDVATIGTSYRLTPHRTK